MGANSLFWIFYNETEGSEKIVIRDEASAEVLSRLLKKQSDQWVMKREALAPTPPPAPEAKRVEPPAFKGAAKELALDPAPRHDERRAQMRYQVELRVILISGNRSFRGITTDVSLGGIKLKNPVSQEFLGGKCTAYISDLESQENIEIVCQVISDLHDPCRIQFSEPDSEQLVRLNKWLQEHSPQKN